ncbi:uroporphyrinogen-III synthase [Halogeometricum borinquense]|uniref:Uroporphyrinogen-III synthase n=1 Tax=Halogeometricum borinquense TaxID=60847 RepID=A0A6C0UCK2_9EURY|nr:uroporphyrinogen-III synthase [Halogeometricum borinquense]QIB72850.1 uroporphyrinogen-III synthase [Halogeometricum borinquense]QIQ75193.1 uroporphyrinogen-III synthase [Halogeometricum borinquense]
MSQQVRVAVFRPDDDRMSDAVELLDSLGATPIPDPMLAVEPTGAMPNSGDYVILTSKTGVELLAEDGWEPNGSTLACIGPATADAARDAGWSVDIVPEEYTSSGLVERLRDDVANATVEVARSDHGSDVLTDGLREAGANLHETVLYRLVRPEGAGQSTVMVAGDEVEGVCFSSSLTVENFLDAAAERGVREEVIEGLNSLVVGVIGPPTRETAESYGINVDVVPENADFEELACAVVETAAPTYHK